MNAAVQRFAEGEPVLIGSRHEPAAFVALGADTIDGDALQRLHDLGRGLVVLALDECNAERLSLRSGAFVATDRLRVDLPFTPSIEAARAGASGWSAADRALTMRIAADPDSGPADLTIPGHVHPVRIPDEQLIARGGAPAASLELARTSGRPGAVALCAVTDDTGDPAPLAQILNNGRLARLSHVSTDELRALARARNARELAIDCSLPTRAGSFRAFAHDATNTGEAIIALLHGTLAERPRPTVYVHTACVLGDVFGSLLCSCHTELSRAFASITADGGGVVLYVKAELQSELRCRRGAPVDAAAVAGLLARLGIRSPRIQGGDQALAAELRALGFDVEQSETFARAA
jgi:3,4-dihydroxy 2-butanone 4-phosphate synthase/GTP cyclohydrolase II